MMSHRKKKSKRRDSNYKQLIREQQQIEAQRTERMVGLVNEQLILGEGNSINQPDQEGRWLKFVVLSDTHCQMGKLMDNIPDGDVLIHCGDFTDNGGVSAIAKFNRQLERLPHKHKIVVAGNHDLCFDSREDFRCSWSEDAAKHLSEPTMLLDSGIEIEGIKIYGSSWVINLPGWAFNMPVGPEIQEKWDKIPEDLDILITHGPPLGYLDIGDRGGHLGDLDLLNAVEQKTPKYHLFGHIHEEYGAVTNGKTIFVNAAQCDVMGRVVRKPIVFYVKVPFGKEQRHPK